MNAESEAERSDYWYLLQRNLQYAKDDGKDREKAW